MNYSKKSNQKNIKKNNSTSARVKSKSNLMLTRIIIALFLIICFAIVGGAFGIYLAILRNAEPMPITKVVPNIYTSEIIVEDTGEIYATLDAKENRIYATLDQIPDHLEHAFISIEDARFYSHSGVDVKGFTRSVYSTVIKGNSQGGSTITQQLIKNARGLLRNDVISKLQEQYLAIKYEEDLTDEFGSKKAAKDHVLELYLNTIAMGHNLNGVQTASNYYYDKDVSEVTIAESAVLASITQRPTMHAPDDYPENNLVRANITLSYMLEQGYITDSEYVEAKYELENEVYNRINESRKVVDEEKSSANSYYTDQVIESVISDLVKIGYPRAEASNLVYNGGLQIHIPVDLTIQNILEETYINDSFFPENQYKIELTYEYSVRNELTNEVENRWVKDYVYSFDEIQPFVDKVLSENLGVNDTLIADKTTPVVQPQSSFIVIEQSTGKVRGVVGGRGEKISNRSLNRATQSLRSPGSVFKIVSVYAPGIDLGLFYPGYTIDDVPTRPDSNNHTFRNWNNRYEGLTTIRRAIYNSINTVAVRGMEEVGIETSMEYLKNFGYTSLAEEGAYNDMTYSTALGGITNGVSNLEMTASYATIANNGNYIEPQFYTVVYDHSGDILLENIPDERKVLSDGAAYLTIDALKDVVTRGTGTRANLSNINMPVAGKTGTTSDSHDLTFAGFTPYYTAGVMYGYDLPESIRGSQVAHIEIWKHIMSEIHTQKSLPSTNFPVPTNITYQNICLDSGLLPNEYCAHDPRGSRIISEIFVSNNVPIDYCDVHDTALVDLSTGLLANDYCPEDSVASIVGLRKVNNYYNTFSYVQNYFSVVEDAIYELPFDYCTIHNEDNRLIIIEPDPTEEEDDEDADNENSDNVDNNEGNDNTNNIELPPQEYYEDDDGRPIPNPNTNVDNNTNNDDNEVNVPEPVVPDEIPEFEEDNLIIP